MRFLSLFSGIGGFDLALERAGHECVGQVEIDGFCQRVLAARWPEVERVEDIRAARMQPARGQGDRTVVDGYCPDSWLGWADARGIDLIVGGFPCQDLSVAGKRAGLAGDRSGLFYEILRIQKIVRAPWGLFENVPGLFSSHGGRDMASVLEGLRQCWPVVGYRVLDSRYFGVPQRRRRIFFVCGPTAAGVEAVLFEPEGGGGDPAAGSEAGAGVAASLTSGVGVTGNAPGRRREDDVNLVTTALRHLGSGGPDDSEAQGGHLIVQQAMSAKWSKGSSGPAGDEHHNLVTHALTGEGHDAGEDGTGRGVPMVTLNAYHGRNQVEGACAPTAMGVRRLTPTECERLQGFPDGWTCLCGGPCRCPDSPRYRALGNAVTVNVVEWLGRRLAEVS